MEYIKSKVNFEGVPLSINNDGTFNWGSYSLYSDLNFKYKWYKNRVVINKQDEFYITSFSEGYIKEILNKQIPNLREKELTSVSNDGIRIFKEKVKPFKTALPIENKGIKGVSYGGGELLDSIDFFDVRIEFRLDRKRYNAEELHKLEELINRFCENIRKLLEKNIYINNTEEENIKYTWDGGCVIYYRLENFVITEIFYFDEKGERHIIE